jgi:hypothetical protein
MLVNEKEENRVMQILGKDRQDRENSAIGI